MATFDQQGVKAVGRELSRQPMVLIAAALGLAAIAVVAVVIATSGSGSNPGSPASAYQVKLTAVLSPLIVANDKLSAALWAIDGSEPSITAAKNAATAVQSSMVATRSAVTVLSVPSSVAFLSTEVEQAHAADKGYLRVVSATLAAPVGQSSSQLQAVATGAQTALVPLGAVIPGAGNSVSGTSNLLSWVAGATAFQQQWASGSHSQAARS